MSSAYLVNGVSVISTSEPDYLSHRWIEVGKQEPREFKSRLISRGGSRFDVEWRLPDRTKRRKTFKTEREARVFEASIVTKTASGEVVDPRAGRVTLATVYRAWLASRLDLSPKVRRGYEDNWRSRIEPRFGNWHVADRPPIDPSLGQ